MVDREAELLGANVHVSELDVLFYSAVLEIKFSSERLFFGEFLDLFNDISSSNIVLQKLCENFGLDRFD